MEAEIGGLSEAARIRINSLDGIKMRLELVKLTIGVILVLRLAARVRARDSVIGCQIVVAKRLVDSATQHTRSQTSA